MACSISLIFCKVVSLADTWAVWAGARGETLGGAGGVPLGVEGDALRRSHGGQLRVRLPLCDPLHGQHQTARRPQGDDLAEFEPGTLQLAPDQLFHVGQRLGNEAGRNFLAADLQEKILSH